MKLRPLFAVVMLFALVGDSPAQRFGGEPKATQKGQAEKKTEPKSEPPRAEPATPTAGKPSGEGGLIAGAGGLFCFIVYCLLVLIFGLAPTWIALIRGHPNAIPIALVNVLLGWLCGIGWVMALIWCFTNPHTAGTTVIFEDRISRRRRRRDGD